MSARQCKPDANRKRDGYWLFEERAPPIRHTSGAAVWRACGQSYGSHALPRRCQDMAWNSRRPIARRVRDPPRLDRETSMKSNDWQGNRIASARRVSRVAIAVGVVAISVSACAARSESPGAEPGSAEKTLDAGTTVSPDAMLAPSPTLCPTTLAVVDSPCPCAYSCEVGTDPDLRCDTLLTGSHGQWTVSQKPARTGCETTSAPSCGATFADVSERQACPVEGAACFYPEARCVCATTCNAAGKSEALGPLDLTWCCKDAGNRDDGCPSVRPRVGSSCKVPTQACDYGACEGNVNLECVAGLWQDVPLECPPPGSVTASL